MRRWNGWGDERTSMPVPDAARRSLAEWVGEATPPRDAALGDVASSLPPSRLQIPGAAADPEARLRHARGQSLPDWVALRSGSVGRVPDAVAYPETAADVRRLLELAKGRGARVVPYGGGTSVVGHLTAPEGDAPVLSVDLSRLSSLVSFDEESRLATFGAGIAGPDLEAQLRSRGYTLGHFPQSFELSTLGGWVVTRSSGQQSLGYGRIERLFAGGSLETPRGTLTLPPLPASAAGPDLRELVLGSEGRLGVLTEATVRVRALPEREEFHAVFLPDLPSALRGARELAQSGLPLSMVRVSLPLETRTTLLLAGHARLIRALERYLSFRGAREEKCLLLFAVTGRESLVRFARSQARGLLAGHGGVAVGRAFGREWARNRFRAPYLRNSLWEAGYAVDTLETAVPWSRVGATLDAVEGALRGALVPLGERVHVFTHLSHVYGDGSSLYTTYLFRIGPEPGETLRRWQLLKGAASAAIVAAGGTISHQHGVGTDHAPYLAAEKGPLGLAAIEAAARALDPDGLMNPGKLLPGGGAA